MHAGGSSKRRRVASATPAGVEQDSIMRLLQSSSRGDMLFACASAAPLAENALQGTLLTALSSVFKTAAAEPAQPFVDLPVSTVTHENRQLVWGRENVPACSSGRDCAALMLPGAVLLGPLSAYLWPEEQIMHDTGDTERLASSLARSGPRFCLMCIRATAETTKLAAEATGCDARVGAQLGVVAPPFCNLVDVVDGYRASAMAIRPDSRCSPAGVSLCGVSKGLRVRMNKLAGDGGRWYVEQTPEIVYTAESPSL